MLQLYYADICPFAQRVRALLTHLEVRHEARPVRLTRRDPAFLALSPTGKVPLLLADGLKVYESAVICDYLADRYSWKQAWHPELRIRTQQKLAMRRFEDFLIPLHYQSMREADFITMERVRELRAELQQFLETVVATGFETENMPGFLVAPFWARIRWMGAHAPVLSVVMENERLVSWLERTLRIPAVAATLPDRQLTVHSYLEKFVYAAAE